MSKSIGFRAKRAIHIAIVLTITFAIQELFSFPRSGWTGFTLMMIYVGFDAGATIQRTFHRFFGVIVGLLTAYILWFICHLDYRLLFMIIPIMVFFAFFSLGKYYMIPTIFTTALTALGTDYYFNDNYAITWLISDYFMCTLVALAVSASCEYFLFRRSHLIYSFYHELQESIITDLSVVLDVLQIRPVNKSYLYKATVRLNSAFLEFNNFVNNTRHDYHKHEVLLRELDVFLEQTRMIYHHIRYLSVNHMDSIRYLQAKYILQELIEQNTSFRLRYGL